jgi:dTDP-glucose 4,6-dehydratase
MSQRVLVTGAGGFIGSHLVEELVRQGYRVRALVRYVSSGSLGKLEELPAELLSEVEVVRGDIRDAECVRRAVRQCTAVLHLAAAISIPYSYVHPREVLETNVVGTLNVLLAALEEQPERVVVTSTSEVFGTAQRIPMDEQHPLRPQSPYAATKVAADALALSFWASYGVPVVVLRPFNTYGPRQSPRAIVPTIILQALQRDEIRLGNRHTRRDLLYVADTVAGFLACLHAPLERILGRSFNLGTGQEVSVEELCAEILRLMGRQGIPVRSEARRQRPETSEVERLCADATAARTVLGWAPRWTLQQGLQQTIAYFAQRLQSFRPEDYLI